MTAAPVTVRWAGDRALRVDLGADAPGPEAARRAAAVQRALERDPPPGILDVVPAYTTVLVTLDVRALADRPWALRSAVSARARAAVATRAADEDGSRARTVDIPVVYGGEEGPDLEAVAAEKGLTPEEVVALHSGRVYTVFALGFRPGQPFLGVLDRRLEIGRLAEPRLRVARGSVGIAGRQTGVYTTPSSGGWRILGRTELPLFDPDAPTLEKGCLLRVGDGVRFVAANSGC